MSNKMKKNQLKQVQNQAQAGYMQNNEPQIAGGEAIYASKYRIRRQNNEPQITGGEEEKQNRIKTRSQSGRSMVEMLGVLAIIAILSIGGIVGFRLAMNYYQANQIAHEMNIMRTDAQIKIAQGTEKLMLGEPYDPISESQLGHIQFNDAYPVDFACALADDEAVELSNISCHVANAYYIELQNIPEGVCRPLAELVNGMNNIIAFDVNKNEYPETGKCEAGNGNVLNAVFSAESVSELKVCTGDTDCESENAPHCDPSRHVCMSCYEDSQCEHNQYCENNTCVTCDSGVWNGEECVECTDNDDCTDTPDTPVCNMAEYKCVECLTYENCIDTPETPQCDEASHTCKSCIDIDLSKPVWGDTQCVECTESTDCSDELVCRGNECTTCQAEEECQEKGATYHCSKEDTCIQCATNEVWDDESRECVECTADDDCTDTPDTPKCNTATNQCVQCLADSDCNNPTPICSEENTCVACKTNEECRLKNPSEENCTKNGACCEDPLMTWNASECVCPEDYGVSETTQGKICLPYCEQEVGIVLLIDRSASTIRDPIEADNNNKYEAKINRALTALTIPEKLKTAVYLDDGTSEEIVRNPLPYGTYSAETIKNTIRTYQIRYLPGGTEFTPALKDIQSHICTGQEKLLIIMWTDAALDTAIGINSQDTEILRQIKNNDCPGSKFYFIAPRNAFSSITDSFFSIDDLPESYAGILNEVIQQEGCVERK